MPDKITLLSKNDTSLPGLEARCQQKYLRPRERVFGRLTIAPADPGGHLHWTYGVASVDALASSFKSAFGLSPQALESLRALAARYVWWKTPDEAMQFPSRVAAQVMNIGDWDDVVAMSDAVGEDYLRHVLKSAEAGQLNARSWHYWHYRLGLADLENNPVPPMPVRTIA